MDVHDAALATPRVMYLHLGGRKVCSSGTIAGGIGAGELPCDFMYLSDVGLQCVTPCNPALLSYMKSHGNLPAPIPPTIFLGSG